MAYINEESRIEKLIMYIEKVQQAYYINDKIILISFECTTKAIKLKTLEKDTTYYIYGLYKHTSKNNNLVIASTADTEPEFIAKALSNIIKAITKTNYYYPLLRIRCAETKPHGKNTIKVFNIEEDSQAK